MHTCTLNYRACYRRTLIPLELNFLAGVEVNFIIKEETNIKKKSYVVVVSFLNPFVVTGVSIETILKRFFFSIAPRDREQSNSSFDDWEKSQEFNLKLAKQIKNFLFIFFYALARSGTTVISWCDVKDASF